jgi:hypothetical protein
MSTSQNTVTASTAPNRCVETNERRLLHRPHHQNPQAAAEYIATFARITTRGAPSPSAHRD